MYPYLDIGPVHLGMFGLLLWLAAVAGTIVLHKNFSRNGVDADALNVVALVVVAGVIGAKLWHEFQDVQRIADGAAAIIGQPGWHHPLRCRDRLSSAGSATGLRGSAGWSPALLC